MKILKDIKDKLAEKKEHVSNYNIIKFNKAQHTI